MKSMIVVALALVAVAAAFPAEDPESLTREVFEQLLDGRYKFGYETDKGTRRGEEGELKEVLDEENKPHTVVVVRGSFTYVNPDGTTETITYEADENGYRPQGPSIPQPPARR